MEITLLTMDVTATSPGTTSATTSQPGDNASTFAQLLSTQPQNTPSDKKNASISGHSSKENKAHNHTEKNKDQQNDDDINTIVTEYAALEAPATKNTHLALSLPDNEQFSSILENKTASSLMSAEELAAELPVQLAGLAGLKSTSLSANQAHQPHLLGTSLKHAGNGNELSHLMAENARAERDLVDKWQQFNTQANADDKSLLAQLRPETASLTQLATHEARHLTNGHSAKKVDNASLLSSVAEKADGLLADDKASANTKLADNLANQVIGNNRIAERDLHNSLSTSSVFASSSVASHAQPSSMMQAQMHFPSMPTPMLNAQIGTPEWQQQLNQQIVMFSRNDLQKAELRLHPEELGSLHIRMKIEDGQAQLHLASQNGQVRTVLENSLHHLRQALSENGIQLTQSQVSSDSHDGWQQQNMSDSSQFSGNGADNHQRSEGNSMQLASETAQKITLTPQELASARGGVDIFA
ncbi:flagellar hook-length control protein FliK [Proteus mirabilis]|uniref:flagellar hook-length control protein FliK n=1 Tax=Proteus mirabilis TaxID=584 RepID=UPI001261FC6C|nr:flagellar hook-length control protein FliK [Proteus mirabilis]KAB7725019.1 flagellar hook-length control protein FliK [Proteus mirabilis]